MSDRVTLSVVASIVGLEIVALLVGINGQIFVTVIATLAGILGYRLGKGSP